MISQFLKSPGLYVAAAFSLAATGFAARADDMDWVPPPAAATSPPAARYPAYIPYSEKGHVAANYQSCYYKSCVCPNGYEQCLRGWKTGCYEEQGRRCCCCCGSLMKPGSVPPSKCLDVYLYRIAFPISPWFSHPRDGVIYPAYGSRSPSCIPGIND